MELALIGNGSIAGSTNISLAASATLDVSGRPDHMLTLAIGQTLQGSGIVNGSLTIGGGAAVSPGGANTIGILTVTNVVTLGGTTYMELNKLVAPRIRSPQPRASIMGHVECRQSCRLAGGQRQLQTVQRRQLQRFLASIVPATPGRDWHGIQAA